MEQQKSGGKLAYFDPFLCLERHLQVQPTPNITGRTAELCRWPGHNHKMGINTLTKWVAHCRSETDQGQVSSILSLTDPKNVSGPSPQPPRLPPPLTHAQNWVVALFKLPPVPAPRNTITLPLIFPSIKLTKKQQRWL